MATGLWGSICLNDFLEGAQVAQAPDGSTWLNLNSLPKDRFKKSDKNQKTYADMAFWIKDELDEYNNAANIAFNVSKEQREAGVKAKTLGYFKYMAAKPAGAPTAQSPVNQPAQSLPWGSAATPPPATQRANTWGGPAQTQPAAQPAANPWSSPTPGGLPF